MKWIVGICAVAVMVAMVATVAVPAQTITPDAATLKLFPASTSGIAFIDVAGLRGAPLFQQTILQQLTAKIPPGLAEFSAQTGFQPVTDISHITVGRIGARDFLAIIQAQFDNSKVQQYVANKGIPSETYLGRVIYEPAAADPAESRGVAFVDNMIFAGRTDAVKQAIDRTAAPAANVTDDADLMAQISAIQVGNQIWAAGKFDANALPGVPAQVGQITNSLVSGTYQMHIDQDVHLKASGTFTTADMAKASADLANGFVAMAKLQFANQQDLMQLFNGLQIQNSGTTLSVSLDATGDALKELRMMGKLRHGR
jgi:hypothetical protein